LKILDSIGSRVRRNGHGRRRRLPAARIAVALGFFLSGAGFAGWLVRIPDIQHRLGLSEGALGLALLGVSAGALIAMPLSGALVGRYGSRPVAQAAMLASALALTLPPQAPNRLLLGLALGVLGAANSVMNVALNTQAAAIEKRIGRPIMAGLHALFSLGGLVGATIGGVVAGVGVDARWHLSGVALAMGALTFWVTPAMLRSGSDGTSGGPGLARPTRPLVVIGALAFCVLFGEGVVADWSAVYLRDAVGAGPGLAAAGFAAFSLMMAAGRFAGDALTLRLGPQRLVRFGAATAAAGVALAVARPEPWTAVIGFGAVGAGLSTIFPTLLTAAGRLSGLSPAAAIAAVSAIGYTGFLAGPPLIGFVAEAISLRGGLALVGITSLLIVVFAGRLPRTSGAAARPSNAVRRHAAARELAAGA
jgi:MFS family permease